MLEIIEIMIVLFIFWIIGGVIVFAINYLKKNIGGVKNMNMELKIGKIIGIAVGIIIFLIILFGSFYTVDTGEVAVISKFGKVASIESAGLHFKIPIIERKDKMEIRERTYYFGKIIDRDIEIDEHNSTKSLEVSTKDMQSILIDLSVQASISNPEKLYKAFKMSYEDRFVRPRVKEVVQSTIAKYTIEEFVSKRAEISLLINKGVANDLSKYGMSVSTVSIVNHDFSDDYEKAIEQKKVAEQAVEKARAEQEKLAVEGENKIKLAEYKLREKKLQAEANKVETSSLSPQILQKMMIEKWDGKLPKVQGNKGMLLNSDLLK